ncbi:hypothetical protein PG997_014291 [Apiospora hydei]|uniref:Uncharacterized protein n=1 Tax=Apiospora hydei TaxID=1337664 RepID=A0ABR1UWH8_9PEZI
MSVFPSFEELFNAGQRSRLTPEAARLYWELQVPLADAVSVMRPDWREKGYFEREPYITIQETMANAADGGGGSAATTSATRHPIAAAPLTEPKISSITVQIDALEIWEDYWSEVEHMYHVEDRPMKKWKLTVKPSSNTGAEAGFVTVDDYVSALHPWLMDLRDTIIYADNVLHQWEPMARPEYYKKLMVNHETIKHIWIEDERQYLMGRLGTENQIQYRPGETYLDWLVPRAEKGDLLAAQEAQLQASIRRVDHGLSQQVLEDLAEFHERHGDEAISRKVESWMERHTETLANPDWEYWVEEREKRRKALLAERHAEMARRVFLEPHEPDVSIHLYLPYLNPPHWYLPHLQNGDGSDSTS